MIPRLHSCARLGAGYLTTRYACQFETPPQFYLNLENTREAESVRRNRPVPQSCILRWLFNSRAPPGRKSTPGTPKHEGQMITHCEPAPGKHNSQSSMLLGYQSFPSDVELQSVEYEPLSKSFDVKDTPRAPAKFTSRISQKWYARFSGWRGGVIAATAIAAFVLLLNTIFAIVAATAWNPSNGIATAYIGDCNLAARWTTAIHLFINLLSSLLLGASNYCMQRLTAPTRKEIDHAHSQKKWLDIGMPSVRNLPFISKSRLTLWILLALGSIPLHFV